MKKALNQISKSPITRGIEKAKLPRRFHQLAHVLRDLFFYNTSTCVVRLPAAFLLVVHIISMLEVMELALLMNIS